MIGAVIFDLDDTLYPQADFLRGAWGAVAEAGSRLGVSRNRLLGALRAICDEGSDRGGIIDRALAAVGAADVDPRPLVEAFHAFRPHRLSLYPGAREAIMEMRAHAPVALVTDGDPAGQQAKIDALGIGECFDATVLSDELGRMWRKPEPRPFLLAAGMIAPHATDVVVVGDRPDKDVAGAHRAGMRAVRVRTGEYASDPGTERPWREVADVTEAVRLLVALSRATEGRQPAAR